ncbi:hypothetical protein [Bailinhaonella thermotolerans]|uniref:Uncharacterized protein n=1 Tax=Bailinhaonella thermotolerans TaxID=1070861 RepID=A0A3A4AYP7_9ACTN|nr:hypothetical protein [Bailinhaonella thermotolerans]RJL32626.1 hypothetical protein D5H75_14035 [Bailinhaonella thermotolerans]
MAEAHVALRRARLIALATASAVCGGMLLHAVLVGTRARGAGPPFADALAFPLPALDRLSPARILWVPLVLAAVAAVLYAVITGTRRGVPPQGAGYAVFLLGWAGATFAAAVAALPFHAASAPYWPGPDLAASGLGRLFWVHVPVAVAWGLLAGWIGGLAAAIAYRRTAPARAPGPGTARTVTPAAGRGSVPGAGAGAPRGTGRAWPAAGGAGGILGLIILAGGLFAFVEQSRGGPAILEFLTFPNPLSANWGLPPSTRRPSWAGLLDPLALVLLAVTSAGLLTLILSPALRRLRNRRGAVFLITWGCAVLVTGLAGLMRGLAIRVAERFGEEVLVVPGFPDLADGAVHGLLYGWLAAAAAAFLWTRRRPPGAHAP